MVKINSIGVGQKTSGTLDGITYVTRKGMTYARAKGKMPKSAFSTPKARKRQAIFKMVQMHIKYHLNTIRQSIEPQGNCNAYNYYYTKNKEHFAKALDSLADRMVAGDDIFITDVEQAICNYATEHPLAIKIGIMSGYSDIYLAGAWPDTITFMTTGRDKTKIIIIADNGSKTVIDPDGTTTVEVGDNGSSGSDSNNSGGSQSGNNSGSNNEQDDDNGGGDEPNL